MNDEIEKKNSNYKRANDKKLEIKIIKIKFEEKNNQVIALKILGARRGNLNGERQEEKEKEKRAVNAKLDVRRHHMLTNNEGDAETNWTFLLGPTRLPYWSGYEIGITRQKIK